ncbi:MAG: WecB/TagA/CpsF family glycosyltransferase [Planctomycetaceae bacterium]|nr:WecB/TagA/CpsF family glycosyltransferase [Planctomycetaceae bacterium]
MIAMTDTIELFGIKIDRLTMRQTVERLIAWTRTESASCHYVVTPNVDHVLMYQERADFRAAYEHASLVVADGAPVVWASRLLGRRLPERVAGSDLTLRLFDAASAEQPLRVYLLGAAPGIGDRAAANIHARWKHVHVTGTFSPPFGFERDEVWNREILDRIAHAAPHVLVLGLGAPKQELWIARHHRHVQAHVALCVGATIDFLAEHKHRAPLWMQRSGLEWAHRVATEPRRLFGRYFRGACQFPALVVRQWQHQYGRTAR